MFKGNVGLSLYFSVHSNFNYESKRVQYQSRLPLGCLSFLNLDIFNKTLTTATLKLVIRICRDSSANNVFQTVWKNKENQCKVQRKLCLKGTRRKEYPQSSLPTGHAHGCVHTQTYPHMHPTNIHCIHTHA